MAAQHEDFWSRRKAAVEAEAAAEVAAVSAAEQARQREALELAQAEKTDAELLNELGLQDPDLMQIGDDFAAFMHSVVPEHLRRKALRRLWLSNPVLANLDGLVDHGEDFTDAATVLPDMKTAYQVGRGMVQHVLALADAQEPALLQADAPEDEAELAQAADAAEVEPEETLADTPAPDHAAAPQDDLSAPPMRRHMRFAFAD